MERFQSVPKFQQYPHFFPVTMTLQEYQHKFEALEPKARCTEESVALAAKVVKGIRRYLEDRNFMEVETPMLFSAAGGAAAQPFVTNSRALGKDLYLRIAPELFLKQLVIGGFDRVFEIGKVFRNEGIDATHNPEFTICEFYQAYADYNTLMDTAEKMISGIAKDVTGSYKIQYPTEESAEEGAEDEPAVVEIDFTPPFKRLPILETLEECLGEKLPDVNSPDSIPALLELCQRHNVECAKPHTCTRLVDKLIGHFVEPMCVNPTFLYNHPTCMSPLAKAHREQQGVTERFELFVAGKELCNAYTELNDPFDQRRRFAAQQLDQQRGDSEAHGKDDEFCTALEYGLPPTGGFGIGIDRLVMLLSGKPHIRVRGLDAALFSLPFAHFVLVPVASVARRRSSCSRP
ncbi:unnamed protein product [Phytophthora fragariaefolia]|uniref:lysine--tRNA ligase n=1 Tax=Phytophthora fragariaefolia TaxID=1490495 RepID=A0A9W6XXD7_9STRA|nr:unnamed protein product [Phytophthora fragariaefolia]